jgi:choline dehydrogenase
VVCICPLLFSDLLAALRLKTEANRDFFVRHSDDDAREARYLHRTWRKPDGGFYVGIDPPEDAKPEGIVSSSDNIGKNEPVNMPQYYPRAGTLGGCAMHNGCER